MRNRRAILYLALALALTIGAHVLLSYKLGVAAALVPRTTLLDAPLAAATRLVVSRPGSPDAVLARTDRWGLVAPYAARVDERAVLKLLDLLSSAEIDETLSDAELQKLARARTDFDLDTTNAVRVTVSTPDAESVISFGLPTPTGDGVYAAVSGEDAVYVVPAAVREAADLPPDGWRERALLPASALAVTSFDLKRGTGAFMRFARDGENWVMREPADTAASAAKIGRLLSDLAETEAVEFVWPVGAPGESASVTASLLAGYGLDPESAVTLTLRGADGEDRQVSFGKAAKSGLVYALVQNAGAVVTVPGALKDQALAGVAEFTDDRLFPGGPASFSRVSITAGDTAYLLAKGEDGAWRLDAPVAAPTDAARVDALLERLAALTSADLADSGVAVAVSTSAAPVTVSRNAALGDLRLDELRSRDILKIDPARVRRLVVSPRGGKPTAVVYDRDRRAWNVERSAGGGTADVEAVEAALAALNPLAAARIVALKVSAADLRTFGLETPRLTLAVDQDRDDAVRRNILVGDATDGGAFATLGAADAVFILDDATVRRLSAPLVKEL